MEAQAAQNAARFGIGTARLSARGMNPTRASAQELDPAERSYFEPRFGCSFADVRLHADAAAGDAAARLAARAYTSGNDIWFGAGQYQPGTPSGRALLAHELTHVVQQRRWAGAGLAPLAQCQPEEGKSETSAEPKEKTLADQGISTGDPAAQSSAAVIDGVLRRNKRLAPYLGARIKGGFSIAEKGRFVLHSSDGNFENAYRKTYSVAAGDPVPKHTTGFFDPQKSVVHLRPGALFGTALHEAMHRSAALPMNTGIAQAAKAISQDLLENLLEGTTAYMVDLVLADEGLPNFNDAYRDEKKKIVGLVKALGNDGFDLVARMYFHGDLVSIGAAVGISKQQYGELTQKGKAFDQVLRKIAALL